MNKLVTTVGWASVDVMFAVREPLLKYVDVQLPPVPVPVTTVVEFAFDEGNGGKTLLTTVGCAGEEVRLVVRESLTGYVEVQAPPVPVPVMIIVEFSTGHENGGKTVLITVGRITVEVMVAVRDWLL